MRQRHLAYLFDLDGTLIDTAPDIGAALNHSLETAGLAPVRSDLVRHWVGFGSRKLIEQALIHHHKQPAQEQIDALLEPFLSYYTEHIADLSKPYPTTVETLTALKTEGIHLAVVTNKLQALAVPVLDALELSPFFDVIVGGDTASRPKPAADPIKYCLQHVAVRPEDALMVGDSITDVDAARAAGVGIVCLRDGYNHGTDVATLDPDRVIDRLSELL